MNSHRFAIRAISVFRVKFNVEFTRQAVNFSIVSIQYIVYFIILKGKLIFPQETGWGQYLQTFTVTYSKAVIH